MPRLGFARMGGAGQSGCMSTQNPFADPNFGSSDAPVNGQPSVSNPFADPDFGKAPATPKRSLLAAINDTVIEGANAAAGTASAIGNFVRPGNAASQWIDKNIVETGEAAQSDVVKAEKARYSQEMQDADGMGGEVGATLGYVARNPLLAAAQAAGSFATPGVVIKGATAGARALGLGTKGTTRAGLAAGAGVGAAGAGGDAAGTAYELSREGGATDEQALAAGRSASVLPGLIGAAGGLVGAERLVAGAGGFKGGLVARALKTGAVEGAQEALEEGVTQYEGQRAAVPFNPDLDPMKGVTGAATMGAVLGGMTGAGASVLTPSQHLGIDRANGPLSRVAADAVDSALAAEPAPEQPQAPLQLAYNPDPMIVFPDGTTGTRAQLDAYIEGLPEDQRIEARARLMGLAPQAADSHLPPEGWQEQYQDQPVRELPPVANPLADMQQAVREATDYTDAGKVEAVRGELEDAWLALNVGEAQPVAAGQASNEAQALQDADPADLTTETNARLRAGRVASGVRNAFDGGAPNTLRVIQHVNQGLRTIGEPTLTSPEIARIRRLADARTAFAGLNQRADLPADPAPAVDANADNSAMEALIPERPALQPAMEPGTPAGAADPAQRAAAGNADIAGDRVGGEWVAFGPSSGTLGVPRARMPQVDAAHRGALVNYLKGQGIASEQAEVPANSLKPTQAEFSEAKVRKASKRTGGDRAILVSSDGYVVDGHHQWLAKRQDGQPVKVLQLQAPISHLLPLVGDFPSARTAEGAQATSQGQPSNGPATPLNDESQAAAPDAPQVQTPGSAVPQQEGVADATQTTQAQQIGAQPQAQAAAGAESQGQGALAPALPQGVAQTGGIQEIKALAQQFRERNLQSGADTDRTFAAVLDGFARDVETGKRTLESVQPALARYKQLAAREIPQQIAEQPTEAAPVPGAEVAASDFADPAAAQQEQAGSDQAETKETDKGVAMFSRTERPAVSNTTAVQMRRTMVQRTVGSLAQGWGQSPRITVVDNMNDPRVPEAVREADQAQRSQGATGEPEGFWYQDQVYLVASALPTSADATRVLYHEVLGHHGLRGRFGAELDKVLDQVAKLRPKDVAAKASEYGLDMGNPDHVAYAAEEVLAELAQTRPDLGFVQRAIAAIRNFLRSHVPGFKALALTDADIVQGYMLPARGWVERGSPAEASGAAEPAFARHPGFSAAVDAAIKAGQLGEVGNGQHIEIATLPTALSAAGIPEGNLRTSAKVLQKVVFDHGVTPSVLKRLPELLETPIMVLRSDSVDGRFVVVTSEMVRGSPLVVAISPEVTRGNVALNFVPSLYPKEDLKAIQRWLNGGRDGKRLLAYLDQKQSPEWFGSTGLQLPSEYRTTQGLQVRNVATQADAVNEAPPGQAMFSRYQPADAIRSSMGNLTPDQQRAYLAVAGYDKVPTLRERFDSLKANLGLRMKQALVDQFAPIAQLDQNAYMLARMSKGSDGTLEAALLYGRPFLRDGVPDVDVKEGGFAKVLAGLQGEHDRFLMHVAAQRAENLKAQGKENLFSDQDITSLKTLNDGLMPDGSSRKQAYAKALAQLNSFNESVLRMAKESGLIDQDAYDLMRDQPYVPFYRLMEEEGGLQGPSFSKGLTNQKAWKKLKGGTEQLNADLLQNMLLNWGNLYAASARNRAALATMDAADKMAVAYKVPSDTKGAAKVMRDGVTEHWMVEDPFLLEAISALNYQASPLMKPLAKAKQWLTWGVTVNPTFKIRNLVRDLVSSVAMADLSYNVGLNFKNGWKLSASDSQIYASMLASGGVIKFGTQENADRARKQVEKLAGVVLDQNGAQKLWGQVKSLYEVYAEFGDRTENVNRVALYERLVAKGHSHAEASFMARDLMDFSMGGSAPVVRFLTQSVPFLNARLQGLYKLGRSAKEDPRRFATVAMAVSLASLGLLAAYADDEDWKRREDWDRDSYWWFKIGETAYRIPKPFEVGAIGTLAERTAEAMFSEEMDSKRFMERISHMVSQTFAFDPMPQAFKPLLDIYANKDSFTGRAIESQADQRLRPEDRYNERTSEVARFLGQVGLPDPARLMKGEYEGLSPKQVDHLLRGYFSWMATASTVASDMLLRNTVVDRGESPAMRLKDVFLVGNFAEGLPSGGSRYVSAMYEQSKSVEQAYAAYRDALASGDHAKASELMDGSGELIRSRGAVNTATKLLAQLNSQAKRVQADPDMSSDEKLERLTRIEQRRHEIAKRVMGSSAT